MSKLVTIGIPVYKRLDYLPNVLRVIAAQDYPNIDLLVSDNGMNGSAVPAIVDRCYPKPYRFRQNPSTVSCSSHFNQLIDNASGEYFIALADDDEISPNYVSELVRLLEKHPGASLALALEEQIDVTGELIRRSKDSVPEILSGPDFIRATWGTSQYGFQSLCTFLAETRRLTACGGFPEIWAATGDEDLLVVKLCLDNFIAFSPRCTFRKRFEETSFGYAIELQDLARGTREFIECLNSNPTLLDYARSHPSEWSELRSCLITNKWRCYYFRWATMYIKRLTTMKWALAAFYMPFIPTYYKAVAHTLFRTLVSSLVRTGREHIPWADNLYRRFRPKPS